MILEFQKQQQGVGMLQNDGCGTDIRHDPAGAPVYWFCRQRFQLPLWPEFLLTIRWEHGHSVEHRDFYVYALEIPLWGNLLLTERDVTVCLNPGDVGIIHRGEGSRLKTGPAGFCRKLSIGIRGPTLTPLLASCGLADKIMVSPGLKSIAIFRELFSQISAGLKLMN